MQPASEAIQQPLELRDYVRPVWVRKWLILAIFVVATGGTYAYFNHQPKRFRASTKVFFQATNVSALLNPDVSVEPDRDLLDQATLLSSRDTAEAVAKQIGYRGKATDLLASIVAQPATGSDFIQLVAVRPTAQEAASVANAFASVFIRTRSAEVRSAIRKRLSTSESQLRLLSPGASNASARQDLTSQIRQLQAALNLPGGIARQVDPALAPAHPYSPRPKRNAVFAAILALMVGVGLAFGLERFDRRIKRLADVGPAYGLPVLTAFPSVDNPARFEDGRPVVSQRLKEPFRSLRTAIQLSAVDQPPRIIAVTSGVSGEGKSMIVRNLALVYREAGSRVAVVDFDLRRPTQPRLFGVEVSQGFTDVLVGDLSLHEGLTPIAVGDPAGDREPSPQSVATLRAEGNGAGAGLGSLMLLPGGGKNTHLDAVIGTDRLGQLLRELSEEFDVVLIDTSPLLAVTDATALLAEADAVVLVARIGATTTTTATRLVELVRRVPTARLAGVVANDVAATDTQDYYGVA
jgi:Mrp family chromosome partitioning ATPase/capsular polysaccharide biosynthesis protein